LDLQKIASTVLESVSVPTMEGGIGQLLKAYENTVFEIPCDGSIPENIKVNLDGQLVNDVFYYQAVPIGQMLSGTGIIPLTYINNEGDNYDVVHGDPGIVNVTTTLVDLTDTPNYIFYSAQPISVRLRGNLVLGRYGSSGTRVRFCYTTDRIASTTGLVYVSDFFDTGTTIRTLFDFVVNLQANEKLFLMYFDLFAQSFALVAGSVSLSFNSKYKPTRPWGVTWFDLYRLLVRAICEKASTTDQMFDYEAVSTLLEANERLFITSGDALRASGDPTYQRFYTSTGGFGPVIKTTLKDCYLSAEAFFCAALGVDGPALYLEALPTVYNSDADTFSLGEVSKLKWKWAEDVAFSDFSIGYPPQSYDQKAGKYEPNTTAIYKAPVNTFSNAIGEKSASIVRTVTALRNYAPILALRLPVQPGMIMIIRLR
jgi:hypothetical protein